MSLKHVSAFGEAFVLLLLFEVVSERALREAIHGHFRAQVHGEHDAEETGGELMRRLPRWNPVGLDVVRPGEHPVALHVTLQAARRLDHLALAALPPLVEALVRLARERVLHAQLAAFGEATVVIVLQAKRRLATHVPLELLRRRLVEANHRRVLVDRQARALFEQAATAAHHRATAPVRHLPEVVLAREDAVAHAHAHSHGLHAIEPIAELRELRQLRAVHVHAAPRWRLLRRRCALFVAAEHDRAATHALALAALLQRTVAQQPTWALAVALLPVNAARRLRVLARELGERSLALDGRPRRLRTRLRLCRLPLQNLSSRLAAPNCHATCTSIAGA